MSSNPLNEAYFIPEDDGWTLPFFFRGEPSYYGPMRGTYRPATPDEHEILMDQFTRLKAQERVSFTARVLASRIKSWSLDKDVTAENIRRLRVPLLNRLAAIVVHQIEAGDVDPEWNDEDREVATSAMLEAAITGTSPVQEAVGELGKNS